MRRLLLVFGLILIAAAVVGPIAYAKKDGVELSSTPFGTKPGDPWTGTLTVISDQINAQMQPTITIRNLDTGKTQTFATHWAKVPTTSHSAAFRFEVIFPTAGRYRYTVHDGVTDRLYTYPVVLITPADSPAAAPSDGGSRGRSIPLWPIVGGAGGGGLLALATFVALRGRRFGLSH